MVRVFPKRRGRVKSFTLPGGGEYRTEKAGFVYVVAVAVDDFTEAFSTGIYLFCSHRIISRCLSAIYLT